MQVPLLLPASCWKLPNLSELPSWQNAKRVAIDCETNDPDLKTLGPGVRRKHNSYLVGVSFAIEDGPAFYLPIAHAGGGNLDKTKVVSYLRDQANHFKGIIVGANLPYDLDWLAEEGIVFRNAAFFRDVQIAEPLIYELHMSYSLDNIAKRHGMGGKDEFLLREAAYAYGVNPKKDLWRLPPQFVGPYAEEDVRLPLRLLRRQEQIIEEQDLWGVYDLESKLLPVLVKMRRRGVRVSEDRLAQVEVWSAQQEQDALDRVKHLTGVHIELGDVWRAEALVPAIKYLGIPTGTTKDGNASIDKEFLASIPHEVARCLEWARKTNKLRTTFAQSVRNHMTDGRIHATFNQLRMEKDDGDLGGAAFGRLSCVNPNLQQQPARGGGENSWRDIDYAKTWRSIYIPEEGMLWASNDYSQQEPRMTVHFGELCELEGAYEAGEKYRNDPETDNHQMMADMAGIKRKAAKEIFLGLCYGMGGAKLCKKLGLPTVWKVVYKVGNKSMWYDMDSPEGVNALKMGGTKIEVAGSEGQALLNTFDSKVPFVKKLARLCEQKAKTRGYIKTLSGRRCRFPEKPGGGYDWAHKGLNRLIQGSSGDQTKAAMVKADEAGFKLQLQVHDEINMSVESFEHADALAEVMRHALPITVPSKVDVEVGASWGESMG